VSQTSQAAKSEALADDAPHLLVVDDDMRIRTLLTRFLNANGFRVTAAASAAEARRQIAGMAFDLLVVDVMMPGETGLEFTEALRQTSQVPILILTARSEVPHRIRGLEIGADDYLAKPFEPRELLLRITGILRRGVQPAPAVVETIRFGPFTFNIGRGELKRGTYSVRITDRERELLRIFAARPGETVKRHEFLQVSNGGGERAVDVQINRLRRKIEADPSNPVHLQTARGIGYRLLVD
jgi:two-component system, OmpR family, phosphate regulon response regulator OmpR